MSNIKNLVLLISILAFLISCGKKVDNNDGLIDETERRLMIECSENLITSKNEIESNLIGEWKLIGHGKSVFQERPQPSINLTISNDKLIFEYKNADVDRVDTLLWEIKVIGSSVTPTFSLNTTPMYTELILYQFCDNYMYGETSPINDGGNMYLYEKVK